MRKGIILSLFVVLTAFTSLYAQDEVLMTINDVEVTKGEFERIYKKNNTQNSIDPKSLQEYLELFINFKLKVMEAESLKMDTAEAFVKELSGYRKQLAKPYLTDQETEDRLMVEAYERMKWDIHAAHILIEVPADAAPEDTLKAYNRIKKAKERISKGDAFEKVANEITEDKYGKQNQNGGDLGYFTAFRMVYPFESAAYKTNVGEVSDIIRTNFGYHLIKVLDKRPARGKVRVAHIMVAVPQGSSEQESHAAKEKIYNIYQKLKDGGDFGALAQEHSDDKGSARKAGELNWFGTGQMVPPFEEAAFSLANPGDYSKPVETNYGWHIIKLIEKQPLDEFENLKKEIKGKISRDARAAQSKNSIVKKLKADYNYTLNQKSLEDFYKVVDESIFEGAWDVSKAAELNTVLFTIGGQETGQQEFAQYLARFQKKGKVLPVKDHIPAMLDKFVEQKILDYEETKLEEKYPDFRYLMKEYHDGILLFELTDKLIWSKAVKDSAGLVAFHEGNKNNYMWPERVDASIYTCPEGKHVDVAKKLAIKRAKKKMTADEYNSALGKQLKDESDFLVKIEDGKFIKGENKLVDKIQWVEGITDAMDDGKGNQAFIYVNKLLPVQPKTLNEAKGLVTADYQTYLETKWVEELRAKYNVTVNKEILNSIK